MKRSFPLVLFLLASACASTPPKTTEPVHVVLVGTTDVHGWFAGHVETPQGGGEGVLWGGLPAFASYVEALREKHPGQVIVVDAGDMWQGTLESNMNEGEAMVRGYNAIGYAAAAVGNHEFDYGPSGPDAIRRTDGQDELGALMRNATIALFPFLSANMVEKPTGRTPSWAKKYTIVNVGNARIGIIGLSTPDTPNVTMASNVVNLSFTDPVQATLIAAAQLRGRGADAVVVVAHMGGRCTETHDPNDLSSCQSNEANQLLQKLPPGTVDAYFAGHTHSQMRHYINGVAAVQASPYSREFSTIDLWIDPAANKVTKSEMRPHTMICTFVYEGTEQCDPRNAPAGARLVPRVYDGQTITADASVARTIEPFLRRVAAKRDEKVGITVAAPFSRTFTGESPLGVLISDSLREYAGSDFAFMNSGGIRAELPAKELTYSEIFAVSPFDNFPATVTMTGAEIVETLRLTSTGVRGLLQVSGLRYTVDAAKDNEKPAGERNRIVSVTRDDGTPLDPSRLYTVAMPDFLAAGGDGTQPVMNAIPGNRIAIAYAFPIRDILIQVWSKKPQPIAPRLEGRITVLNLPPAS